MANIRREFGDDLTLKNGNLGINTTTAQERVDVIGVVKGTDLNATGVSSLTAYEGFLRADNQIVEETNLEFGNSLKASLSGEIIVGTGVTVTIGAVGLGTTSVGVGTYTIQSNIDTTDINLAGGSQIECLKVYNTFTPPSGGTNERPYKPKPGELYYNYDFKTIEFYDGYGWRQVDNTTKSGRAVFGGGYTPGPVFINQMEYVNINTLGNSQYFGDLLGRIAFAQACGSGIRGLYAGDRNPESTSPIEYITIASAGNSIDFGELSAKAEQPGGSCSSSTRGIWGGRSPSPGAQSNVIDYVEINTLGNAVDFGDLKDPSWGTAAVGSTVRGVFVTGSAPSPGYSGELTYITIASKGNSVRFGDLTQRRMTPARGSNSSGRGVLAGGSSFNTIDYITISTEGNATYFGDLSEVLNNAASCGVSGRMIRFGGITPSFTNTIEYVVISTMGNALDFGDCALSRSVAGATSDSHGGLGGF